MKRILAQIEKKRGAHSRELVEKAHAFMMRAHAGQKRVGGAGYHTHPEAVARILVEQGHTDPMLLAAALLHDVVEDTGKTLMDIREQFGDEVMFLVDAATDVGKGDGAAPISDTFERMRRSQEKILAAGKRDPRIFLIKTADRIHNLRTMGALSPARQDRLSREARDFHTKLAHRVGAEELAEIIGELAHEHLEG